MLNCVFIWFVKHLSLRKSNNKWDVATVLIKSVILYIKINCLKHSKFLVYLQHQINLHFVALKWSHVGHNGISNHRCLNCLLNRLVRCRSRKGNYPVTGEFPAQRACNAENISIWSHHHGIWLSLHLCGWQCYCTLELSVLRHILSTICMGLLQNKHQLWQVGDTAF